MELQNEFGIESTSNMLRWMRIWCRVGLGLIGFPLFFAQSVHLIASDDSFLIVLIIFYAFGSILTIPIFFAWVLSAVFGTHYTLLEKGVSLATFTSLLQSPLQSPFGISMLVLVILSILSAALPFPHFILG